MSLINLSFAASTEIMISRLHLLLLGALEKKQILATIFYAKTYFSLGYSPFQRTSTSVLHDSWVHVADWIFCGTCMVQIPRNCSVNVSVKSFPSSNWKGTHRSATVSENNQGVKWIWAMRTQHREIEAPNSTRLLASTLTGPFNEDDSIAQTSFVLSILLSIIKLTSQCSVGWQITKKLTTSCLRKLSS